MPDSEPRYPARYTFTERNFLLYGDLVERLAPYFFQGDPLADDVVELFASLPPGKGKALLDRALASGIDSLTSPPPALARLFAQVDHVPLWVDWDMINLGGATYLRSGFLGAAALLCYSLPYGYLNPGANKPLVFSGRLVQRAYRRLLETSRFVYEVCKKDGLQRQGAGFMISIRVRLMHAQVRRLLLTSGRWRPADWGSPINQTDMLGTNLLFSIIVLDALRRTGIHLSARETEAVLQLWKYSGYLMGVDPEILIANEREGWRILDLIMASRGAADADSRTLTNALMDAGAEVAHYTLGFKRKPRWVAGALYGLSRYYIGHSHARELEYPRSLWLLTAPLLRGLVMFVEALRRIIPGGQRFFVKLGSSMWQFAVERGLRGRSAEFAMPEKIQKGGANHER